MTSTVLIIVLGVVVALAVIAWAVFSKRRSERLRSRFGSEYDHTVDVYGNRRKAESELAHREERVEKFHIRNLSEGERTRFAAAWRQCQQRFVDDPDGAIVEADRLCTEVMRARGYPISDFDQRAADLSVEHPRVVEHYREAHQVALRRERDEADTEDVRQAMVHYRALFEDLSGAPVAAR